MIKLTLELYTANKELLGGTKDDMEIGISNIMNTNITNTGLIVLGKSLNGHKRISFFEKIKSGGINLGNNFRADSVLPWSELITVLKRNKISNIDKELIEHEVSDLYLNTINDGNDEFIKNIKLELKW